MEGNGTLRKGDMKTQKDRAEADNMEAAQTSIGKYTVLKLLGEGGEGNVYLARDEDLQRVVAVKRMGRSLREADYLKTLRHPMLPVVYELLRDEEWYLVMEYMQGVTLRGYIERNGCVCQEQVFLWAEQLLDVTEYLHTRKPPVIYRDFKPDNVMVCTDGQLRLVDFGAAAVKNYGMRAGGVMAATPGYAAPEQFGAQGVQAYADERSDIYSLGRLFYYMMTGVNLAKPPYASLPLHVYQPMVHPRLERIINKCMSGQPEERYQTAEELKSELAGCRKGKGRLYCKSFIRAVEKKIWLTEMQPETCIVSQSEVLQSGNEGCAF